MKRLEGKLTVKQAIDLGTNSTRIENIPVLMSGGSKKKLDFCYEKTLSWMIFYTTLFL